MKGQLSFEFLMYLAVSLASLAVILPLFMRGSAVQNESTSQSYIQEFVALVNTNMENYQSRFVAFIPDAICNSSVSGSGIEYSNTLYAFNSQVVIPKGALCDYGNMVDEFNMTKEYNGTYLINVVSG